MISITEREKAVVLSILKHAAPSEGFRGVIDHGYEVIIQQGG